MPSILERLRAALGGEYDVERELASGGMGVVFLARERSLDRLVAIKVLRPEWATAVAAERFLREARTLAGLNHLAIVPIHRVGEADGLPYFVMEYLDGGTLADRLRNGPLKRREVFHLGLGLLGALDKAHRNRVLHRDIKPANVFYREDQPVLGDFGIAKGASDESLTGSGYAAGTPGYMAPEQLTGQPATAATDVYGFGMLLYEAATGCRWLGVPGLADPDKWTGVPRRLARVLQRALRPDPADRWKDAGAFRTALLRAKARRNPVFIAAGVVSVGVAVFLLAPRRPPPDFTDLAILPFEVASGPEDRELGTFLARTTKLHLELATATGITVTPMRLASALWDRVGRVVDSIGPEAARELRARFVAYSTVMRDGDSVAVRVQVVFATGMVRQTERIAGTFEDLNDLGFRIAHALVRIVAPGKGSRFQSSPSRSAAVLDAFNRGELNFERERLAAAEEAYIEALALDSTFALAHWRRFNVRRWRRLPLDRDHLADIYARYPDDFNDLDRLLIEADLAPPTQRMEIYRRAIASAPNDGYPWLLYGNELFHRGALAGFELDSAVAALDSAGRLNPLLAPVQSTLTWALIRLGDEKGAEAARRLYNEIAAPETDPGFCFECTLRLTWTERFRPDSVDRVRGEFLDSPESMAELRRQFRWAPAFGVPASMVTVGGMFAAASPDPATRADALVAQGLGLVALGRMRAAIAHFDSAAAAVGDPEYELQAAQWRVVPHVVGMPGLSVDEVQRGRAVLERLSLHPTLGARAAWTLSLHGFAAGDSVVARSWSDGLGQGDSATMWLRAMADGIGTARAGDLRGALQHTERILEMDVGGRGGDPFLRALLHLERGRWLDRLDDPGADSTWLWYLNADAVGGLTGIAQAAEIDWAFETYARYLRGMAAQRLGDRRRVCDVLPEALARWSDAESSHDDLVREVEAAVALCGGR
ncbi:MAG: protein kinase [Gemmatimonadetes bacterium]|nr:protein kinase [Gemmatimonadota bacterium]